MPRIQLIKIRRDTAANWAAANPVLALGEPGYATDTKVQKTGDGVTAWNSLAANGSTTYAPISSLATVIAYNGDGSVNTVTETASGAVTTYTYNGDGTPATESRVLSGVTTLRTFAYSGGNLIGVS